MSSPPLPAGCAPLGGSEEPTTVHLQDHLTPVVKAPGEPDANALGVCILNVPKGCCGEGLVLTGGAIGGRRSPKAKRWV